MNKTDPLTPSSITLGQGVMGDSDGDKKMKRKEIKMKRIIISIIMLSGLTMFVFADYSISEEVVLCISHADQYIVMVNEKGDCIDTENQLIISGSGMEAKKNMTPVANFKTDEKCDGEGIITEIGFDENGNGQLDSNEIVNSTGTCPSLVLAEESSEE